MNSLTKNTIYNLTSQFLIVAFPFATMAYVSRILSPEGVGKIASAQNIVAYFMLIASLGIPMYGVKKIAECKDNIVERSKVFFSLLFISTVSTFACSILYTVFLWFLEYFDGNEKLSLAVALPLVFNFLYIDWFFQGIENFKFITIRTILVKFVSFILIVILVKSKSDFVLYAIIISLSTVVNNLISFFFIKKKVRLSHHELHIKKHLKPILVLLMSNIAIEIYTLADVTMLNLFKGDEIVGYYSTAMKISLVFRGLVAAFGTAYLPRINYYYNQNSQDEFNRLIQKGIGILFTFSVPAMVGVMIVSRDLIPYLFGEEFAKASITTAILSISIVTAVLSNFTGYQILLTIGKEKIILISTIIGAFTNIILNFILIPQLAHNGAAIASIITEGMVSVYQLIVIRMLKIRIFNKRIVISTIVSTIIMATLVILMNHFVVNTLIRIFIDVLLGVCIYFGFGSVLKNEIVVNLISNIRNMSKLKG